MLIFQPAQISAFGLKELDSNMMKLYHLGMILLKFHKLSYQVTQS